MPKSQFTDSYRLFLGVLIAARKEANLTQAELAALIGKKQTFISIIETGVRRIDGWSGEWRWPQLISPVYAAGGYFFLPSSRVSHGIR